jgi:hypothetical protein
MSTPQWKLDLQTRLKAKKFGSALAPKLQQQQQAVARDTISSIFWLVNY